MAKTKAELESPSYNAPDVRVKVTYRGHGKISTGMRVPHEGDIMFEEGDEFVVNETIALNLVGEDKENRDNSKNWVEILGPAEAEKKAA